MKKTRFILIITLLLVILSLFMISMQFATNPPEKTLMEAFKNSGAETVSSEISFRGKIDKNTFKTLDDLKRLVAGISVELGGTGDVSSGRIVDNDFIESVEVDDAVGSDRNIAINAANSRNAGDTDGSYITVSVIESAADPGLEEIRRNVLKTLGKYGVEPKVNSCITGWYAGKLDYNRLNDICTGIFKKAEARKVEGIRENNLISVSAYTPAIGESVNVNGNLVNLNLAARYNSYEDKTYLWLATPVITTEY